MNADDLEIATIESMPFGQNTYLVKRRDSSDCVVIDPGMEPELIVDRLRELDATPAAFLITHGHCDHIAGIPALKQIWPECPVVVGRGDAEKLTDARQNLSAQYGMPYTVGPADVLLDDGEVYSAAGLEFETHLIPGHSSGHVVFIVRGHDVPIVFGGDVLFQGSIGRTDFPGGSFPQLAAGIRSKLYVLPDATAVYPGHGPPTTVGDEKRTNPFVPGEE